MENVVREISWRELENLLVMNRKFYEGVRLVDPVTLCQVLINDQGEVVEDTGSCYDVWQKSSKCTNCISLYAYNMNCSMSKMENFDGKNYHVLSNPVCVIDEQGKKHKLVMETKTRTLQNPEQDKKYILIVEDEEINRDIIHNIFQDEYNVLEASNGREALRLLEKYAKHIIAVVLDLIMPEMDGYEVMKKISSNPGFEEIPILVTTESIDRATEQRCLEAGAWDFVQKPIDSEVLKLRLRNIIGRSQYNYQKYERHIVDYDNLTGLYKRTKFFEETNKLLQEHTDKEFVFLCVDLDRFRQYNAFYGEREGDRLLLFLAQRIYKSMQGNELAVCGRIEADVFAICCENDDAFLEQFQASLLQDLKEYKDTYYIEPSIGIYHIEDTDLSVESMYEKASMAAESCKHKFMSYVGYYNENMTKQVLMEQEIMNDAQKALEEEQFVVYLQPKNNIHTQKICGAEALVRWIHPEKGMISPGIFIPVFENNGFIGQLDYYMWEHTCMLLRKWIDEGMNPEPVSVNVSRANMYNINFVNQLRDLVIKYQIPARLLQLELTESAFMDDPDIMIRRVKELQENGFTILMDDFGSGYSSLNTLKDIPVDILKIDMKFLGTGVGNGRSERILASVVRMAAWLDLVTIVEGVETQEQRNFLESIGCKYAQGYYYARPMPWQEYEELIKNPKVVEDNLEDVVNRSETIKKIWTRNPEMEKIFNSMMQPAVIHEYDGKNVILLQANSEFVQGFGYDPSESIILRKNNKFIPEKYVTNIRRAISDSGETGKVITCDYLRINESGENRWYQTKVQFLCRVGDSVIGISSFTDVTQEKELEQEVRHYKALCDGKIQIMPKMLVVDDLEISRAVIKELFQEQFEVIEAENGKQALDILQEQSDDISIILLDMNMPVMDGKEFLKYKNGSKEYVDIPVIVISVNDDQDHQVEMLRNGVNDYVTKPFIPEVVERRVMNVLEYNSRFRRMMKEYHTICTTAD